MPLSPRLPRAEPEIMQDPSEQSRWKTTCSMRDKVRRGNRGLGRVSMVDQRKCINHRAEVRTLQEKGDLKAGSYKGVFPAVLSPSY